MSAPVATRRPVPPVSPESGDPPSWLTIVSDKVQTMRYGVVQVVVHDGKVVQIERTERTRFDVPRDATAEA